MSLYRDVIEVRRRDAGTAGDTEVVALCDLVLSDGIDGNPIGEEGARRQALIELGRQFPDSRTADAAMLVRVRHIDDVLATPVWAAP